MQMRPLAVGGVFERAVMLYARNAAPFLGIASVPLVPVAILQYAIVARAQPQLDATLDLLAHPDQIRAAHHLPTLLDSPLLLAGLIAATLLGYYALGFAIAALAGAVARRYRGEPLRVRDSLAMAAARSASIVAVVGIAVLALLATYVVVLAAVSIPVVAGAALGAGTLASIAPIAVGVMLAAIAFALLMVVVASACALCAVVVEGYPAATAVHVTVARLFNRIEFRRALLVGFAVGVLAMGASTIVDVAIVSGLSRWPVACVALEAAERTAIVPLLSLVLAVYYFDVRVRREGLDVESAMEPLEDEPSYAPTAYLSGEERAMVKRFIERRDAMTPARRRALAAQLAAPVRPRVPVELQRLDDEALLERL
jgi:hypothetical protein